VTEIASLRTILTIPTNRFSMFLVFHIFKVYIQKKTMFGLLCPFPSKLVKKSEQNQGTRLHPSKSKIPSLRFIFNNLKKIHFFCISLYDFYNFLVVFYIYIFLFLFDRFCHFPLYFMVFSTTKFSSDEMGRGSDCCLYICRFQII